VRNPQLAAEVLRFETDDRLFSVLPDSVADGSEPYRGESSKTVKGKLALLLYYCHALAIYNPRDRILNNETEKTAAIAWERALSDMEQATALFDKLEADTRARKKRAQHSKIA
jgi:hypothetical protein